MIAALSLYYSLFLCGVGADCFEDILITLHLNFFTHFEVSGFRFLSMRNIEKLCSCVLEKSLETVLVVSG